MENTVNANTPPNSGLSDGLASTLNKASSSAHAAVNSLADAADQAAQKAKPTIERVAAAAHQAVDKAAGAAGPAADWLSEKGDSMGAMQKKMASDTCAFVSANPWKSIGMALAAGFVLSRIIR